MINKIIQYISSFIYQKNVDIYSLETDYMDVHGTNFEEIYEMKLIIMRKKIYYERYHIYLK